MLRGCGARGSRLAREAQQRSSSSALGPRALCAGRHGGGQAVPRVPEGLSLAPWLAAAQRGRACAAAAAAGGDGGSSGSSTPAQPPAPHDSGRLAQLLGLRLPSYCCGCGVKLQQTDPDAPGFYQVPRRLLELAEQQAAELQGSGGDAASLEQPSAEERQRRSLDAALEAWLDEQQRPAVPSLGGPEQRGADAEQERPEAAITCARCYSLVHYKQVRSQAAEAALPAFDLGKKVGRKIALQRDRRATVLCVVDVTDFDGSLPRSALASLFPGASPGGDATADVPLPPAALDGEQLPFTLAVAVNKLDLLPPQATPRRVEQWVRTRLKQAGLPRPSRVFTVSAATGAGVADMLRSLRDDMGFRADLWVVGAQNAGKSSLIAAMRRLGGASSGSSSGGGGGGPTVAPIPGTTLGLLRVPGVPLGPKHRTFDTPGVPHAYQLTSRLTLDELGAVLPRRRIKPRTYVLPIGGSLLLGGLARIDALSGPSANIYVTVFASDEVVTHMGKTAGVEERRERHAGGLLAPPFDPARLAALRLVPRTAVVQGDSWQRHARDIAIAGLGWVSVGVLGTAELAVWAPEGVMVTSHDPLVPDYAKVWQKPGFSALLPATKARAQVAAARAGDASDASDGSSSDDGGDAAADGAGARRQQHRGSAAPAPAASAAGGGSASRGRAPAPRQRQARRGPSAAGRPRRASSRPRGAAT